jgi:isopenicillin-N epimerase
MKSARAAWPLDESVTYLNHGTIGVTPKRVLAKQQQLRDEMERAPAAFLLREVTPMIGVDAKKRVGRLRAAAHEVAAFLGAAGDDLGFVVNVTAAVNAVLRSVKLAAGDEILVLEHAYGAIVNAANAVARGCGARVVTVAMPSPISPEGCVDVVRAAVSERTKLCILDHVTSGSALVLPIRAMVSAVREKSSALVCVDGAHAPGAIDVDISAIDADFYTANLHKWMWTPRSCGILWARRDRQRGAHLVDGHLHAPILSWGLDGGIVDELDWQGTLDPTAALASTEAIAMMREHGVAEVRGHNHALAMRAARTLNERLGATCDAPESMIGTMVTLQLPSSLGSTFEDAARMRDALWFDHKIEVQLFANNGALYTRISAQVYVDDDDIVHFARALEKLATPGSR